MLPHRVILIPEHSEKVGMKAHVTLSTALLAVFLSSLGIVTLLSAQEEPERGKSAAVPVREETRLDVDIDQSVQTRVGVLYGISSTRGFLVSFNNGRLWEQRNDGLPRRVVYPFHDNRIRLLTSVGIDPAHDQRVAVTTADSLFVSEDFGRTWHKVELGKPMRSTSYLTSVALSPTDQDVVLVGTSFNGFFETTDRGQNWHDPSLSARFLYRGAGFYEEITAMAYFPEDPERIVFACGFGKGLYISDSNRREWIELDFPGRLKGEIIETLAFRLRETPLGYSKWVLEAGTQESVWYYSPFDNLWWHGRQRNSSAPIQLDPRKRERLETASNRFGIYVSSYHAQGDFLDAHLEFTKEHGLNALVVDFKDDMGWITYDTTLPLPKQMGAVNRRFRVEELLEKAHERDLYVIARIVVFKDKHLYEQQAYEYAAWDFRKDAPWRNLRRSRDPQTGRETYVQNEYWVDPFAQAVWEYTVSIAEELAARGVDEIQFDYVRFPSDGNLASIVYRHQREGMTKIDCIESLLILARSRIDIPISLDLYGFNSWFRMGNWIGQSIELLAHYADAICPMFYPSHFPNDFIVEHGYLERARLIYQEGTQRAGRIVAGQSVIRPFIQAFLIGGELSMTEPEYTKYLLKQIEGVRQAPASGFTLWNASNRYYMVNLPLHDYF